MNNNPNRLPDLGLDDFDGELSEVVLCWRRMISSHGIPWVSGSCAQLDPTLQLET